MYDGRAALRVAEGSLDPADLRAELHNISGYVVEAIPPGTDANNDHWRARVADLRAKLAAATSTARHPVATSGFLYGEACGEPARGGPCQITLGHGGPHRS